MRARHIGGEGRREDERVPSKIDTTRGATIYRILRRSRGERDAGAVPARPRAPPAPLRAARVSSRRERCTRRSRTRAPAHETGGGQMPVPVRPRASRVAEETEVSRPVRWSVFFPASPLAPTPTRAPARRPRRPPLPPAPAPRCPVPARTRTPALRGARPSTRAATRPQPRGVAREGRPTAPAVNPAPRARPRAGTSVVDPRSNAGPGPHPPPQGQAHASAPSRRPLCRTRPRTTPRRAATLRRTPPRPGDGSRRGSPPSRDATGILRERVRRRRAPRRPSLRGGAFVRRRALIRAERAP